MNAWTELGLDPGSDVCKDSGAVRQAYADRLRAMDPDSDPAAFARLRAARDRALNQIRWSAANAVPPENGPEDGPAIIDDAIDPSDAEPVCPWPHAARHIALPIPQGRITATGEPVAPPQPIARASAGPADAPLTWHAAPFALPVIAAKDPGDVIADRGRSAAFQQLLEGAPPSEPFDEATERRARDHLTALLRMADATSIEHSRGFEDWIADRLANAWPRSAPLLAPAANAFGWTNVRGQITERPSIAFLNARLAGLRFVEAVETPGHRYHKAWAELSKPGSFRNRLVLQSDVRQLLEGVRKHFPEIETYLNPQRVAVWDKAAWRRRPVGLRFWRINLRAGWYWWVFAVMALRLIGGLFAGEADPGGYQHPVVYASPTGDSVAARQEIRANAALDTAAARWFGPGTDFAQAGKIAPRVAALAASNAGGTTDPDAADHAMRDAVFRALEEQAYHADPATMRSIQALRLELLDASARIGQMACYDFLARSLLDDKVAVSEDQTARARRILHKLATTGAFGKNPARERHTVDIPGAVITRIESVTGLPDSTVRDGLMHRVEHDRQCTVSRALIREALRLPPGEGNPILRIQ